MFVHTETGMGETLYVHGWTLSVGIKHTPHIRVFSFVFVIVSTLFLFNTCTAMVVVFVVKSKFN